MTATTAARETCKTLVRFCYAFSYKETTNPGKFGAQTIGKLKKSAHKMKQGEGTTDLRKPRSDGDEAA